MAVETTEYLSALRGQIVAAGIRVGDAGEVELRQLSYMVRDLDNALQVAARAQAARHSWAWVGDALGVTRQAAHKRFADTAW